MDTKLDRRDNQYNPRIHQGRNRACGYRQNNLGPEIGLVAGTITRIIIEEEEITLVIEVIENIVPISEIVVGLERETTIEMGTGTTIDQITEVTIMTKGIETDM